MALVEQGRRPTIDFGYPYGLLPIWIGSAWFSAPWRDSACLSDRQRDAGPHDGLGDRADRPLVAGIYRGPIAIELIEPNYGYALTLIPRLIATVKQRQPIFKNEFFAVYRRARD